MAGLSGPAGSPPALRKGRSCRDEPSTACSHSTLPQLQEPAGLSAWFKLRLHRQGALYEAGCSRPLSCHPHETPTLEVALNR